MSKITAAVVAVLLTATVSQAGELLDFKFRWLDKFNVVDTRGFQFPTTEVREKTILSWEWCALVFTEEGEERAFVNVNLGDNGAGSLNINSSRHGIPPFGAPDTVAWYCMNGSAM